MAIDFPSSPYINQQFSSGGTTWTWDGTSWNLYISTYSIYQSTEPTGIIAGQLWVNSSNNNIYIWDGESWEPIGIDLSEYATIASPTFTGTVNIPTLNVTTKLITEETMTIAVSDEVTSITTGAAKVTMRAPFAMTLTQIPRASLSVASTSGIPTVDINVNGSSILGANKLTIDANEKTSTTAATPTTIATSSIADDAEITMDIDVAGTGAKGLKVTLYFKRS